MKNPLNEKEKTTYACRGVSVSGDCSQRDKPCVKPLGQCLSQGAPPTGRPTLKPNPRVSTRPPKIPSKEQKIDTLICYLRFFLRGKRIHRNKLLSQNVELFTVISRFGESPGRFVYCRGPGHPAPSCEKPPNFMYARPPCCFSLGLCLVKALGRLLVWPAASLQPVFADRCERWKFDLVSIGTSKASLRLITSNRAKALNRAATCWTLAVLKTKQSSFCLSTPSCSVTV